MGIAAYDATRREMTMTQFYAFNIQLGKAIKTTLSLLKVRPSHSPLI